MHNRVVWDRRCQVDPWQAVLRVIGLIPPVDKGSAKLGVWARTVHGKTALPRILAYG